MTFERDKTIRAARLSIALLITFFITWYFEIPEGMWALITCCFVLFEFTTFGGVSAKSWMRFTATFCSAIYSILIIYFFDNNIIINLMALIVGIFIYAYLYLDKKDMYISVLGCVTLTLTLINYNHTDASILRPFNIALGILICMLTFKFFYPAYAREKIIKVQVNFIGHLSQIIRDFLDKQQSLEQSKDNYLEHEMGLIADISTFTRCIEEAKMEMLKDSTFIRVNLVAFGYCKRLYRLISVLIYHVSTEELRHTEGISVKSQEIFVCLQKTLERIEQLKLFNVMPLQTEFENAAPMSQAFIHLLFKEIMEQIILYNKALDTIIPICLNHYREN